MKSIEEYYQMDRESAEKDLSHALELAPNDLNALCTRGYYFYCMEEKDAALRDFERAIEVAPDCSSGYYYRGLINLSNKNWEAALSDFDKSIELESGSDNYKAYAFRANAKIELKQYLRAKLDLDKFVKNSPDPQQSKFEFITVGEKPFGRFDGIEIGSPSLFKLFFFR